MKIERLIIKEQAREIRRLKSENKEFSRRQTVGAEKEDIQDHGEMLAARLRTRRLMNAENFPGYLLRSLRGSSPYRHWMRALTYFRRMKLVSTIIKIISALITLIETGAVAVITIIVLVILVPFFLLCALAVTIAAITKGRYLNRIMSEELKDKRVFVAFAQTSTRDGCGSVLNSTLLGLAEDPHNAVFVVSPFFISSCGFGADKFYLTLRKENNNLYFIRKYYFFMLRGGVLESIPKETVYLY